MYKFSDNSPEACAWRGQQADVDNAIEGIEKDEATAALTDQWDAEGLSQDEQAERIIEMARPKARSMAM